MDTTKAALLDHQATLTSQLRNFIYRKVSLPRLSGVLDVGCGTGFIAAEMARRNVNVTGVDTDSDAILVARKNYPAVKFEAVEKGTLPFGDGSFDLAFCHFVLLWQNEPERFVAELSRVVKKGGYVVAAAEPDYGGRISHPDDGLTADMIEALKAMGADPLMGRKVRDVFSGAGLNCEAGIWPSMVESPCTEKDFEMEWITYEHILRDHPAYEKLEPAKENAQAADAKGGRTVSLPLFYAIGTVIED